MKILQKLHEHRIQNRLNQLQSNQGQCLELFKQSAGQQLLNNVNNTTSKTLLRDALLIIKNPSLFDTATLTRACRLCPEAVIDLRGPNQCHRLQAVLKTLDANKPTDHVLALSCLAAIANSPDNTLDVVDLCFLNQSLLGNPDVFAAKEAFSSVLDAAQALEYPAWTQAAQAQLIHGNIDNAGWLFAQAIARCETVAQQQQTLGELFSTLVSDNNFLTIAPTVIPFRAGGTAVKEAIIASEHLFNDSQRAILLGYCFEAGQPLSASQWSHVLKYQLNEHPDALNYQLLSHHPIAKLAESGPISVHVLENLARAIMQTTNNNASHVQQRRDSVWLFLQHLDPAEVSTEQDHYLSALLDFVAEYNEWDRLSEFINRQSENEAQYFAKALMRSNKTDFISRFFPPERHFNWLLGIADELSSSENSQDQAIYHQLLDTCAQVGQLRDLLHKSALLEYYCNTSAFDKLTSGPFNAKESLSFIRSQSLDPVPLLKFITQRQLAGLATEGIGQVALLQRLLSEALTTHACAEHSETLGQCVARLSQEPDGLSPTLNTFYATWQPWQPLPLTLTTILHECSKHKREQVIPQALVKTIGQFNIANDFRRNQFTAAVLETVLVGKKAQLVSITVTPEQNQSCGVCYTDFAAGESAYRLTQQCQSLQCMDCITNSVQNLKKGNQCQWDCQCTVHSNTAIAFDQSTDIIQSIQSSTLAGYFAHQPHWQQCDDDECVGGNPVIEKDCQLCHNLETSKPKSEYVDALKIQKRTVRLLMDHLGQVSGHYNGNGMVRECFCCGRAMSKDHNCATVTCADTPVGCGQPSDFVGGDRPGEGVGRNHYYHKSPMPAQAYIPTRQHSVLWQLGFYDRNPFVNVAAIPKTNNPELMTLLIRTKEQWFNLYEKNIDQLIAKAELDLAQQSKIDKPLTKLTNDLRVFSPQQFFGKQLIKNIDIKNSNGGKTPSSQIVQSGLFYLPGDQVCFKNSNKQWEIGIVESIQNDNKIVVEDTAGKQHLLVTGMDENATCLPYGCMPVLPKQLLEGDRIELKIRQIGLVRNTEHWEYARIISNDNGLIKAKREHDGSQITISSHETIAVAGLHQRALNHDHSTEDAFLKGMKLLSTMMQKS